jgi:hypothetical protein
MKLFVALTAASIAFAVPAFAQTTPPAPAAAPATTPSPATAAPMAVPISTTKDGKPKAKEVRKACAADAKAKGLKGDDKRKAEMDCVVKERPDLAAKEQCRMDGKAKGLKKDELKSFVKDCAKGKS